MQNTKCSKLNWEQFNKTEWSTLYFRFTGNKKYKYELRRHITFGLPIEFTTTFGNQYLFVLKGGSWVQVRESYAWDGASFFPDFANCLIPSLIHDVLYQLLREGKAGNVTRSIADEIFYRACRRCGVSWITARIMWVGVRLFGRRFSYGRKHA